MRRVKKESFRLFIITAGIIFLPIATVLWFLATLYDGVTEGFIKNFPNLKTCYSMVIGDMLDPDRIEERHKDEV